MTHEASDILTSDSANPANQPPCILTVNPNAIAWNRKWGLRSPSQLASRLREIGAPKYLVEGLLPPRSLAILVGDSGIGKSPLAYQLGICIAAGVPFLGRPVNDAGVVAYFDFENGLEDSQMITESVSRHLGLVQRPENFLVWHMNDAMENYGELDHTLSDMLNDVKPCVAIVDSLGSYDPDAEDKNASANRLLRGFRRLIRANGTTTIFLHHRKKPSQKPDEAAMPLERETNVRRWFRQARGATALINGTDVRLGVEETTRNPRGDKPAFVLRGFGRVRGDIGPIHIARALDEDGEPQGYSPMAGVELLFNPEQEGIFPRLPSSFRFKEAKQIYRKGDQATKDFLDKCINAGLLRKPSKGQYEKVGKESGVSGVVQ